MFRSVYAGVKSRPLLVVLAAVFAGLAMLLVVSAAVVGQPLVLMAAVPLAMTALLMWYHGTGRLAAGLFGGGARRRRRAGHSTAGTADGGTHSGEGGPSAAGDGGADPWEVPFEEEARRERRYRARRQARRTSGDGGSSRADWDDRRTRQERPDRLGGLTRAEAYEVLGLDPTASEEDVREAYREQAKATHPDTEGGSAEEFQELNDAYERIVGE